MKTYLVTGAAGFIGSNFVKYILKKHGNDVNIIIVDALTYAGNLASIKEEIEQPTSLIMPPLSRFSIHIILILW